MRWPFGKKEPQNSSTPVEGFDDDTYEEGHEDELSGIVEESLSMWWVIEIFDPPMDYPRDPLTEPPLLYGPHDDPLTALEILDKMLTALNEEVDLFTGRIRPLFVPEVV